MGSIQEFAARIKAKYPQYSDMPDSVLAEKVLAKHPQYRDMVDRGGHSEKAQPLTMGEAMFPSFSIPEPDSQTVRVAKRIPNTMAFDPLDFEERRVPVTDVERVGRAATRGMFDALSLPARAAGAAWGDRLGWDATGKKQGLEALADQETGLGRPVREWAGEMVSSGIQGGEDGQRGPVDYAKVAAGIPPYLLASIAEDPTTWLIPGAKPAAAVASKMGKGIQRGAQSADRLAGKFAEEASGVPEEALRAWGTAEGRTAIKANAGQEFEIGQDLVRMIENFDDYLPEKEAVNRILEAMPEISPEQALGAFRRSKAATSLTPGKPAVVEVNHPRLDLKPSTVPWEEGPARNRSFDYLTGDPEIKVKSPGEPGKPLGAVPTEDVANRRIDDLMDRLRLMAGEDIHTGQMGSIPAKKFRDLRISYDTEARAAFKKDEREILERALLNARNQMAADLRTAAAESGDEEFSRVMQSYSNKLDKLERIKKFLGGNAETREARAEGFIGNLLNSNKTYQQGLLKDLEEVFDADLMSRVQGAKWAKQIGKDGEPALLPVQWTGRSNLAQTLGGAITLPFSSPAIASRVTLPLFRKLAQAKLPVELAAYVTALRGAGATAAQIDAVYGAAEALGSNSEWGDDMLPPWLRKSTIEPPALPPYLAPFVH